MEPKSILEDYRRNFCNRIFIVETNYAKIREIPILFKENQLPHLLGLHKLLKYRNATQAIQKIDRQQITMPTLMKNKNFYRVRGRFENYHFFTRDFS